MLTSMLFMKVTYDSSYNVSPQKLVMTYNFHATKTLVCRFVMYFSATVNRAERKCQSSRATEFFQHSRQQWQYVTRKSTQV